jgi:hypothetical protein
MHCTVAEWFVNTHADHPDPLKKNQKSITNEDYWVVWMSLWTPAFGRIGPTSRGVAEAIATRSNALFPDIIHLVASQMPNVDRDGFPSRAMGGAR